MERRLLSLLLLLFLLLCMSLLLIHCGGNSAATAAGSNGSGTSGGTGGTGGNGSGAAAASVPVTNRGGYVRTDFVPPNGTTAELPSHWLVYDPWRKQIFLANRTLNRVDVISTTVDRSRKGSIPVPEPTSVDLSPDGSSLYVGTAVEFIYVVDPAQLQVRKRVLVPFLQGTYTTPKEVVAAANGTVLIRETSGPLTSGGAIVQWFPATGQFLLRTDSPLIGGRVGSCRASGDHTKILFGSDDSSGQLAMYDSTTDKFVASTSFPGGIAGSLAATFDGSRFAVLSASGYLAVYDGNLSPLVQKALGNASASPSLVNNGLLFGFGGSPLYVFRTDTYVPVVEAYSLTDGIMLGDLPDVRINSPQTDRPFDVDETGIVFATTDRGVSFVDVTGPYVTGITGPVVGFPNPTFAPVNQTAAVNVPTANATSAARVFFGTQEAGNVTVGGTSGSNQSIGATAPASAVPGPVDFKTFFGNNWFAYSPESFNYGLSILYQPVMAGVTQGGTYATLYGYGWSGGSNGSVGVNPPGWSVTVGGRASPEVRLIWNAGILPYPFPLNTLMFQVPPGQSGKTDVTITSPTGSVTLPQAFRYASLTRVPLPSRYFQGLLDSTRHRLYLSDQARNIVQVISTDTLQGIGTIVMPGGSNRMQIGGMALLPDGSGLAVVNGPDNVVFLINPDNPASSPKSYSTALATDPAGLRPFQVAATNDGHLFVNMTFLGTGCLSGIVREIDLATGGVAARTEYENHLCPDVNSDMAGTPDGSQIVWNMDGAGLVWHSTTNSFEVNGINPDANVRDATYAAVAADGNRAAVGMYVTDQDLHELTHYADLDINQTFPRTVGIGVHPSGSLVYYPSDDGVEIVDANSGTVLRRIAIPDPVLDPYTDASVATHNTIVVDDTGSRVYLLTSGGLDVLTLDAPPLGIGSVQPSSGSVGSSVTIRGSGFTSASAVMVEGTAAATTFVDTNTVTVLMPAHAAGAVRLTVTNAASNDSYALDAAFTYQ